MREITTIWFKSINNDKATLTARDYKTGNPGIAMRRFFAERGHRTWLMPVKIETRKEV